jgi:cell pole-organizing protein PopZ
VLELTEMVEPPRPQSEETIASPSTVAASAGIFAGLQAAARTPPASDVRLGDGALTLEQLVRSELRGMLQAWLDAHLPGTVERLVQKEIKRITRQVDET